MTSKKKRHRAKVRVFYKDKIAKPGDYVDDLDARDKKWLLEADRIEVV